MTTTTDLTPCTDAERFVALGVNGAGSLNWRISLGTTQTEAARLLQIAGDYNGFDPREVMMTLAAYWDHVSAFELARECSMAVYATLPYWRHQTLSAAGTLTPGEWLTRPEQPGERISVEETRHVARALAGNLLDDRADEVTITDDEARSSLIHSSRPVRIEELGRPYRIRAWWD